MPNVTLADMEQLPPTQYLILEVLESRYRTGTTYWTFPNSLRQAAGHLEEAGLVWLRSGPEPGWFEARLTDTATGILLSQTWAQPGRDVLVRHLAAHRWGSSSMSAHGDHVHHWECAVCNKDLPAIVGKVLDYRAEHIPGWAPPPDPDRDPGLVRVPCAVHNQHALLPDQAARVILTLYGLCEDICGDAESFADVSATPRYRCAAQILAWSTDSEMYAEYVNEQIGDGHLADTATQPGR